MLRHSPAGIVLVIAGLVTSLVAAPTATASTTSTFVVPMTGAEIVNRSGDPDGTGTATITVDVKAETVCYSVQTENVFEPPDNPLNSAFIGNAPRGENGLTVVVLWDNPIFAANHDGCGELRVPDLVKDAKRLLKDMVKNPQDYYVVVTSEVHDGGAIRGQLG